MDSSREKDIERKFAEAARKVGGIAPKLVSPGYNGMPDRLALLPYGRMGFVEVKAPGRKLRPLQEARRRHLQKLGFKVYVLDSTEDIPRILDEIGGMDGNDINE